MVEQYEIYKPWLVGQEKTSYISKPNVSTPKQNVATPKQNVATPKQTTNKTTRENIKDRASNLRNNIKQNFNDYKTEAGNDILQWDEQQKLIDATPTTTSKIVGGALGYANLIPVGSLAGQAAGKLAPGLMKNVATFTAKNPMIARGLTELGQESYEETIEGVRDRNMINNNFISGKGKELLDQTMAKYPNISREQAVNAILTAVPELGQNGITANDYLKNQQPLQKGKFDKAVDLGNKVGNTFGTMWTEAYDLAKFLGKSFLDTGDALNPFIDANNIGTAKQNVGQIYRKGVDGVGNAINSSVDYFYHF